MAKVLIGYSTCNLTREAFEHQGHEVWTCDLLPARGGTDPARHLQEDVWDVLVRPGWDFAVLHPMCTYLTTSAAWAFGDGPYHQKVKPGTLVGKERREARDKALTNFRRLLELPFPVAIENPGGSFVNKAIRPPNQVIHPYMFGDDASKSTGLWLTKGTPVLVPTQHVAPRRVCRSGHDRDITTETCPYCGDKTLPRWANQTNSGQNRLSPSEDRWLERSRTFPGIAEAMGQQWGGWLNKHTGD